mgnify:CR=1 FL=1
MFTGVNIEDFIRFTKNIFHSPEIRITCAHYTDLEMSFDYSNAQSNSKMVITY